DSDVDHPAISVEATVVDPADANLTATGNDSLAITVDANADGAEGSNGDDGDDDHLSVKILSIADSNDADAVFSTGESGHVTVKATFDDYLDGSESHSFTLTAPAGFTIDGIDASSLPLPAGVSFVLADDKSSITFTMPTTSAEGAELTVTLDVTNVSAADGQPKFTASAKAVETNTPQPNVECDDSPEDNIATVTDEASVTVANVSAPEVSLTLA